MHHNNVSISDFDKMSTFPVNRGDNRASSFEESTHFHGDYCLERKFLSDVDNIVRLDRNGLSFVLGQGIEVRSFAYPCNAQLNEKDLVVGDILIKFIDLTLDRKISGVSDFRGILLRHDAISLQFAL